jgi:hypothetical protein
MGVVVCASAVTPIEFEKYPCQFSIFFKKSVKYLLDDHPDSSLPHYLVGLQQRAFLLLFVKSGASRRVILYVDCRRGRVGMFDLDEAAGV